jgi:hypothetical protein
MVTRDEGAFLAGRYARSQLVLKLRPLGSEPPLKRTLRASVEVLSRAEYEAVL